MGFVFDNLHGIGEFKMYTNGRTVPTFRTTTYVSQPHFGVKCEKAIHTPKNGKMESSGTLENLKDDLRGQISSPWCVLYINGSS